jgi:hypothetical protein
VTPECFPKNHFMKANMAQFVFSLSQIPEIMGEKEKQSDWHPDDFSRGKR